MSEEKKDADKLLNKATNVAIDLKAVAKIDAGELKKLAADEAIAVLVVAKKDADDLREKTASKNTDSIWQIREDFKDHAVSDARNFAALRDDMRKGFGDVNVGLREMGEALAPLSEAYSGLLFSKKFIVGIAGVVLAIAAVGGAIIWIVNASIKH